MTFLCVVFAALAAGLTMGLVSVDPFQLKIVMETDVADSANEAERLELLQEKVYARAILPLVERHHLLLVTLLLFNSLANEALPLFLDQIVPSYLAILLSVTLVLFFGEIVPSAIFTGKNQLKIGACLAPLVWLFVGVTFPLSYPLAAALDFLLGADHMGRYRRAELKALIELHRHNVNESTGVGSEFGFLNQDEIRIIHGVLECKETPVSEIMTSMDRVFMLSLDDKLDTKTMAQMMGAGKSRIPVYEHSRHNIRGMLLMKQLVAVSPEDARQIRTLLARQPLFVTKELGLLELLHKMRGKSNHFAVVCDRPDLVKRAIKTNKPIPPHVHMAGIVTIEDVLERMLKEEIEDEFDGSSSVRSRLRVSNRLAKLRELVAFEKKKMVGIDENESLGSELKLLSPNTTTPSTHTFQRTESLNLDNQEQATVITTVITKPNRGGSVSNLLSPQGASKVSPAAAAVANSRAIAQLEGSLQAATTGYGALDEHHEPRTLNPRTNKQTNHLRCCQCTGYRAAGSLQAATTSYRCYRALDQHHAKDQRSKLTSKC
eukprot:g80521.t1